MFHIFPSEVVLYSCSTCVKTYDFRFAQNTFYGFLGSRLWGLLNSFHFITEKNTSSVSKSRFKFLFSNLSCLKLLLSDMFDQSIVKNPV